MLELTIKGETKMNNDDFISFKALKDKLGELMDSDNPDCSELSPEELSEVITTFLPDMLGDMEPPTEEELYDEIVEMFCFLINQLEIEEFSFFRFSNLDYCRVIIVDGKEYDLDGAFSHDDDAATEALCAIDSLIADIACTYGESEEAILKKVQAMINIKNGV